MKKLSIEQKARRYDEALKVIKGNLDALNEITETGAETVNIQSIKNCFYRAFPELKESEDEKTMKDLLNFLKSPFIKDNICDWKVDPWIVWLEKQYQIKESDISQQENDYSLTCEDNRIMKDIINTIERYIEHIVNDENYAPDAKYFLVKELEGQIAWLEKQKPVIEIKTPEESLGIDSATYNKIVDECIYGEQNLADKPDTVFHEGDWIVQENIGVYKVIEVCESWYEVIDIEDNHYSISFDKEYMCHLWTIKDAKPGDVIYLPNGNNEYDFFIFKGIENAAVISFVHFYQYNDGTSKVEGTIDKLCSVNDIFQPATKEQREILFKAMTDVGYTFDFEKKELKIIDWSKHIKYEPNAPSIIKESNWSEEDENFFNDTIAFLENTKNALDHADWIKSLKQRIEGQSIKQEEKDLLLQDLKWCDMETNECHCYNCELFDNKNNVCKCIDLCKRPKNTYKGFYVK